MMKNISLYIHVPFCRSFCPYCDFYKVKYTEALGRAYASAVVREIKKLKEEYGDINVETLYFGGGTPSVLSGEVFSDITTSVKELLSLSPTAEFTVECNPSSDLEHLLPILADCGVNRISLGLQSAVLSERQALGRQASAERVFECAELIRSCGIENISVDLMLGIPHQSTESFLTSLEAAVKLKVPHISAYMLKLEEGTVFYKRADSLSLPSEDEVSDMYLSMCDFLEAHGLMQYEISNFAVPGFESRHNLAYWQNREYAGIGAGAHSYLDGRRSYYPRDLQAFIDGCERTDDGKGGSYEERLMLALRLREGFREPLSDYTANAAANPKLAPFIINDENGLRLTREGFLVSNTIISELIP